MQDPKNFSPDPSNLYGRVFPKELRDAIFKMAVKVLGIDPESRDSYVGTEYYTMRLIEDVGARLIAEGNEATFDGVGYFQAWGAWLDFSTMVAEGSYFPKAYVPKADKADTAPKPAAKPQTGPIGGTVKPGTMLGEIVDPAVKAELGITPAPAPTIEPSKRIKRKGGAKPAEAQAATDATPAATDATPAATDATEPEPAKLAAVG